jgi:hypothetical protein
MSSILSSSAQFLFILNARDTIRTTPHGLHYGWTSKMAARGKIRQSCLWFTEPTYSTSFQNLIWVLLTPKTVQYKTTENLRPGMPNIPKLNITRLLASAAHSLQPHPQQFGRRAPLTPQTQTHPGAHYPSHDNEPAEQLASYVGQKHGNLLHIRQIRTVYTVFCTLCRMQNNAFCSQTRFSLVELRSHKI